MISLSNKVTSICRTINKVSFWVSGKIAIDLPKIYLRNFLRAETYLQPSRTSMMEVFHIVNGYKPL